jgi:hypothetical protein
MVSYYHTRIACGLTELADKKKKGNPVLNKNPTGLCPLTPVGWGRQHFSQPRLIKTQTITALNKEAPLVLAGDRDVSAEPLPVKIGQNPATLELWLKRTKDIVHRSKTDAAATVTTRIHERLQHCFRHRKLKKAAPRRSSSANCAHCTHCTHCTTQRERSGESWTSPMP